MTSPGCLLTTTFWPAVTFVHSFVVRRVRLKTEGPGTSAPVEIVPWRMWYSRMGTVMDAFLGSHISFRGVPAMFSNALSEGATI